jgi:outer membrane receptor protein involved in Fe transport
MRGKLSSNLNWNVALYNTRTVNDIQFIFSAQSLGYFKNVGETERKGLEIGIHGKVDKLNLAANYGFVDATYRSNFEVDTITGPQMVNKGNRIPGIARQTFKLRATYEVTPSWNVGGNVIVAASQYARGAENNQTFVINGQEDVAPKVPGYAILNLDTNYSLNSDWNLFAKVNNVFDKEYSTFGQLEQNIYTGIYEQFRTPSAPRAAWVGVTYNFGGDKKTGGDKAE